ncbi:Tetratricopeptide repeat protein 4 [Podospora aff. communis PSN243]|uniref:Tetratricopeptide repeat protein 4 n=1 Tax=Podospora aff. communis PSN243 TaxID=3040156 RepID=A0AAV9GTJ9_9PEZI|nr:Tetratricopeptide repeat protein 4 [Podospora aff. communis PSN243]
MDQVTKDLASSLNLTGDGGGEAANKSVSLNPADILAAMPKMPPGRSMTVDETVAELKKHPIFMTEMEDVENAEDNLELAAIQAIAYDGTPLENATNFKEQGNECFRAKNWADAKEFYTKGIALLTAEDTRRASSSLPTAEDTPETISAQHSLLETLHGNRAACHLELRNFRSCTTDCAAALRLNPSNVKALYRSARALFALDKLPLALDAVSHGLSLDPSNPSLSSLQSQITARASALSAKAASEAARASQAQKRAHLLKTALAARGIRTRSTGNKPEMEDARIHLTPSEDDPTSTLSFPTLLLYPLQNDMDFIKGFNETQTLENHFGYVFPTPWDKSGEYSTGGVECFMETTGGGLVKVGKKVPLLKVLSGSSVEVVDDLIKIFVVPKGKAERWVREYKEKKGVADVKGK